MRPIAGLLCVKYQAAHRLFEGPPLTAFPPEFIAAEDRSEQSTTTCVEQMPGAQEVEGRVGRAEATDVKNSGEASVG